MFVTNSVFHKVCIIDFPILYSFSFIYPGMWKILQWIGIWLYVEEAQIMEHCGVSSMVEFTVARLSLATEN